MSKTWQPYALHILDAINKIRQIQARGWLTDKTNRGYSSTCVF
jgi:hypothetical protein